MPRALPMPDATDSEPDTSGVGWSRLDKLENSR